MKLHESDSCSDINDPLLVIVLWTKPMYLMVYKERRQKCQVEVNFLYEKVKGIEMMCVEW